MPGPFVLIKAALRPSRERPPPPTSSLASLLADEARHALRVMLHPAVLAALVVVGATVWVLLGPATPGFVLGGGWRGAVAVVVAVVGAVFANGMLRRSRDSASATTAAMIAAVVLAVGGTLVVATLAALVVPDLGTAGGTPPDLSADLPIDPGLAAAGLLVVVAILASAVGRRLRVPTALVFLLLGMVVGADAFGLVRVDPTPGLHQLAVVALVLILFDGGVATDARDLRAAAAPGALLATVGVVVSAAIVAGLALVVLPIDARTAWLLGFVVAPTDAAALAAILRRARLPRRITAILTVESGGNDPMAVLLTAGILASWDAPVAVGSWMAFLLWQVVGGIVVGTALGWLGASVLRRVDLPGPALYPLLAVAIAVMTYGAAALVGASGLLAAWIAGLAVARWVPRRRHAIRGFAEGVATTVEVGLFLLLGLLVDLAGLTTVLVPALVVALVTLVVARPLSVVLSLTALDLPRRDVGVVAWLGVRGAVPIVLATQALVTGVGGGQDVFDVVFVVVSVTLVVQAVLAERIVDQLAPDPDEAGRSRIEYVTGTDVAGLALLEVEVDPGAAVAGRALRAVPPPRGMRILALRRGDVSLVPDGDTRVAPGDVLVVTATGDDEAARVRDWLHEAPGS